MATKPNTATGGEGAAGEKKKGKGLLIGILVAVLLAGGGGAGWYFTRPQPDPDEQQAFKPSKKAAETVFMTLDPFTLNLADAGGERLVQVGVALELASADIQNQVNRNLPVIRNSLLLLISSQESKTLLSLDGKLALADEIAIRTGMALGWRPEEPEPVVSADDRATARLVAGRRVAARPAPARPNPVVAVHFAQFLVQ